MLNHTFDGVMAVYSHATYDSERRQPLEAWSAWLSGFLKLPTDVIRLRTAAGTAGP
jgi:hypothetical protein